MSIYINVLKWTFHKKQIYTACITVIQLFRSKTASQIDSINKNLKSTKRNQRLR